MNKQTKIVSITLMVLALLLVLLLWANSLGLPDGASGQISLKLDGEFLVLLEREDLLALPSCDFQVTQRAGGKQAQENVYSGIELRVLLESYEVDVSQLRQVKVRGADGYMAIITGSELRQEGSVYLAYAVGGRDFPGSHPYQLVISNDYFATRWCRLVAEIEAESLTHKRAH